LLFAYTDVRLTLHSFPTRRSSDLAIHRLSNRRNKEYIKVDVGALTETLFESELFGYKKGAFTDAREDRKGRFEAADGGTLFLDEDRKSTRLNSSHVKISYAVFCLK